MSYAIIESYTDSTATVTIGGLEYPAEKYECFKLYLDGTHMGRNDPTSWSSTNEAHVQFDLTQTADGRTTASGSYSAKIYAVWKGSEYNVPISGSSWIKIENGGGSGDDPTPRNHPLTRVDILEFVMVEDDHIEIKVQTDGYGEVDLVSVTKAWNLYTGEKDSRYVYIDTCRIREDLLEDGEFYGRLLYYPKATDMSVFPNVPTGTCHLRYNGNYSKAFICMSQYNNWSVYDGTYSTTLKYDSGKMYAGVDYLSTVKSDWTRLVNMAFYLEATAYGTIKYAQYSDYIPRYGDVITAGMYNSLIESVDRCCRYLDFRYYDMPSYVSSGQIIPKNFIYKLGQAIDACLLHQRTRVNERVLRGY